jgi:hypothetical protein
VRVSHLWIGYSIVGGFALLALWGGAAALIRRGAGRAFWWLLTFVQVAVLVQVFSGAVLLVAGGRRPFLHYLYGAVFPALVLGAAHWLAREALQDRPWIPFAVAGFVAFGLTLRALTTGLGIE